MVGADHIGLSDYPIFDEQYREFLNAKIIDHYWYREIGLETVDMFIRQLRTKMHEIMPYYNKWYLAENYMADINPLSTQDVHSTGSAQSHSSSSSKEKHGESSDNTIDSTSKSKGRTVQSETPQTMLSGNQDYATAATDNHSAADGITKVHNAGSSESSADNSATTGSGNETHSWGYSGHAPTLIDAWRSTFANIDMMVIDELETLFMGIYSSNDGFTGRRHPGYGLWY
nr:MAG TPA: Lower collar protein [Caudoviricetes sp.]